MPKIRSTMMPVLMLVLAGCLSTFVAIPDVHQQPVGVPLTREQVGAAILAGASDAGWQARQVEPGKISAAYHIRVHTVQVSIPYTAASYDIVYDGSDKMKVLCPPTGKLEIVTGDQACPGDQRPVRIHPNYKTWIDELNTMIVAQLGRVR